MAVTTQKLLPGSKSSALAIRSSKIIVSSKDKDDDKIEKKKKGGALVQSEGGGLSKEILQMKKNVLKLQGSVDKNDKADKKEQDDKRKSSEKEERVKRERKFELKGLNLKGIGLPKVAANLPGGTLVDMIKRYLGFTFLGWLVGKYEQLMPQLEKFMSMAKSVFNGLVFTIDAVTKGIFGFVDAGYKAYDKISSGIKSLGGENAAKTFNDFSNHFNKLLNGAIVASMLLMGTASKKPNAPKGPSGSAPRGSSGGVRPAPGMGGRPRVTTSGGGAAGRPDIRNPLRQRPRITGTGGKFAKFGKFGGGRIPIIGPLITLGIRTIIYKEPLAKAATAAVGMGIGQAIGGFIGTLGAGALGLGTLGLGAVVAPLIIGAGSIIGGLVGEWLGAALYDFLAASSGKNNKGAKKAVGGQVTSPKSSSKFVQKKKKKNIPVKPKINAQKTQPGKDVGGRDRIETFYGKDRVKPKDPTDTRTRGQVIVKQLEASSNEIKKLPIDWIASLGGAFMDLALGQKPDKKVSRDVARSFSVYTESLANDQISLTVNNITRALIGMANGGLLPETLSAEEKKDLGSKVEKNIERRLENILNQASNITFKNILNKSQAKTVQEILEMQEASRNRQGAPLGAGSFPGGEIPRGGRAYPTTQEQAQAFERIRKIAEKLGSPDPEVTASIAMWETGWLANPNSVYFASGKTNPFGQTGKGPKGSVIGADGQPHAIYNNIEEGVKAHLDLWKDAYRGKTPAEVIENIRRGGGRGMYNTNPAWSTNIYGVYESVKSGRISYAGGTALRVSGSGAKIRAGQSRVSADIGEWHKFRSATFGAPSQREATAETGFYKIRELGVFGSGNYNISPLADDTSYEIEEHKGSGHWENRAFDIPVPNLEAGDRVDAWWRSRGYTTIWRSEGHFNHVHVEVPANKAKDWFKILKQGDLIEKPAFGKPATGKYDIIIPLDHVPPNMRNKIPDKKNGNTFAFASQLGADGREREYTGSIATYIAEKLKKQGYRVKIVRPEDYGSFENYDNFIVNQSNRGATVLPFHLDADPRRGGTGFLARIKKGDVDDKKLAQNLVPVLKKYTSIFGGGQKFGGIDEQQNATIDRAASSPAALLELGSLVTLEKLYGKNFVNHPEYKRFMDELTGAISGSVVKRPPAIKKGTASVLNGRRVEWNGKNWMPIETNVNRITGLTSKEKQVLQMMRNVQQRPWWDKFGFFGGAAARPTVQRKLKKVRRVLTGDPSKIRPGGPGSPGTTLIRGAQGGGSISNEQSSRYSSLNKSGSLKTETSYNEQMVIMVQREIVMAQ